MVYWLDCVRLKVCPESVPRGLSPTGKAAATTILCISIIISISILLITCTLWNNLPRYVREACDLKNLISFRLIDIS